MDQREHVLEETPFSLKVLGHIVLVRGKNLLDGHVYAQVRPYKRI